MVSASSASRYQRRVFGLGALGTVLLLVIGAPIFNNRIEDDLEHRVPSELAEDGFSGITATFSGQDGTLRCAAPLDDPERAIEAAYDVWGVRAIVIDRSCRVNRAPTVETTTTVVDDGDQDRSGATAVTAGDDELVDNVPTAPSTPPDFDTVAGIVATSPQLSLLSVLIEEADMTGIVDAEQPVTLFAPTDEAFDAVPADALAKLRATPETLRRVLRHHAVTGALSSDDLVDGTLATLDGGAVEIVIDDSGISVSGANVVSPDIMAANGIVHIIDQVLIPADVDVSVSGQFAATTASFENGEITLVGGRRQRGRAGGLDRRRQRSRRLDRNRRSAHRES